MGKLTKKLNFSALLFAITGLSSCGLLGISAWLDKGYINQYNQYVPKNPKYDLKDKPGNVIMSDLDTFNVYRVFQRYYKGVPHPWPQDKSSDMNKITSYMKFYSNGRCLSFFIPVKNDFGSDNILKESDLNPNSDFYKKGYYHSIDGEIIKVESFVKGESYGVYLTFDYFLGRYGDTLTSIYKESKTVYVREMIPLNWKSYLADW